MTQQHLVTTPANSSLGDSPKSAFDKCENNFNELYSLVPASAGASAVIYQPPFVGGVPETVATKLAQTINVLDFAANGSSGPLVDPTGSLDSTAGFQAAANAANATGAQAVVPNGVYSLSSVVTGPFYFEGLATLANGSAGSLISTTPVQEIVTNPLLFGGGNTAVAGSFVGNSTLPAQVFQPATPPDIASFAGRENVGLFAYNIANAPIANVTGTFSTTQFFPTVAFSGAAIAKFRVGMFIDTTDATKFSGTITGWDLAGASVTVSGWFQQGNTAAGQTPAGPRALINPTTSVFGANIVVTNNLSSLTTKCTGLEVDMNDVSPTSSTNGNIGILSANITTNLANSAFATGGSGAWQFGFHVAGTPEGQQDPTQAGFVSSQMTGSILAGTATMVSGRILSFPTLIVDFNGNFTVGSRTVAGTRTLGFNSSGHATSDAIFSVSGGTGASDGTLNILAGAVQVNGTTIANAVAANPTSLVSPAVVNGSASTFMRSDAAPAINLASNYAWAGGQAFSGAIGFQTATTAVALGNAGAGIPAVFITSSTAAADSKVWRLLSNTDLLWQTRNDANTAGSTFLDVARSGSAVTSIAFGNATDNPTYSFLGTGAITGVGSGLTTLNASNISSGTIAAARLPAGVAPILSGTTAAIGGSALLAGQVAQGTVTIAGATTSMVATASPSADPDSSLSTGIAIYAFVSAANTVTVRVCAIVAVTPAAVTYNVRVIQ